MAMDKFDKLEEGLSRLLSGYEAVKAENDALKASLRSKDAEVGELKEKLTRLDREKGQVREKVDGLLSRLNNLIEGV